MILSTLKESQRVESLHPLFKKAFDFIKCNNLIEVEPGKIEIEGDKLFINNSLVDALAKDKQVLEVHKRYIDIHVLLEGKETVGWLPADEAIKVKQAFDEASDCALYFDKPSTYVDMKPGDFLIVYPEDAHAPIIGEGKIRKLIVKVLLDF